MAGEDIAIVDAVLTVDGVAVIEAHVDRARIDGVYFGPFVVPTGTVVVMGDDRFSSIDSRSYGPVPLDAVVGRVVDH